MPNFSLNAPVKILVSKEYGKRLLFMNSPVNPRDELGKMGITFHTNIFRKFYKTIPIKMNLISFIKGYFEITTTLFLTSDFSFLS